MFFIKIRTPQHVIIKYPLAGPGKRIPAALIDLIITFSYWYFLYWIFFKKLYHPSYDVSSRYYEENERYYHQLLALFILLTLPVYIYHFLCENFMEGQSFGKRIMGIKVVMLDGTQPSFQALALRSVFRLVDVFFMGGIVGLLAMILSGKGQRLGDMAAGTTVIRLLPVVPLFSLMRQEEGPVKISFSSAQLAMLQDRDIQVIRKVLDNPHALSPQSIAKLASKIRKKISSSSDTANDIDFLKQVYTAYSREEFKDEEIL